MHIIPDNAQHIGTRKQQEDSFGFSMIENEALIDKRGCLAIICDGMGGLSLGKTVSSMAVQSFLQYYQDLSIEGTIPALLKGAAMYANEKVCELAAMEGMENQIGTTLIAVVIKDEYMYWLSIGDSRIYLFRNDALTQLTQDHTYVNELYQDVANGVISKEEAEADPQKEALTSYVGLNPLKEIDCNTIPFPIQAGDRILLCSDGVYGFLSNQELVHTVKEYNQHVCHELIQLVLSKGHPHQDNATAALLDVKEDPTPVVKASVTQKVPNKKKKGGVLAIFLVIFLSVVFTAGSYISYVHFIKTDKYKEILEIDFGFFQNEKESR